MKLSIGVKLFVLSIGVAASVAHGQVRKIEDPSITEQRLKNSIHAQLEINGRQVEVAFSRETVPGDTFLTVWESFPDFTAVSNYRYIGHEGNVIRFRFEQSLERRSGGSSPLVERQFDTVVSYFSKDGGKFTIIPKELQYTKLQFQVIALPDRGIIGAFLLDDGKPR